MSRQGGIQIVHIGFVMATMVNLHGGLVNRRLEGISGVRERGKFKRHRSFS